MSAAPWLAIARAEIGVHETPGPASTARILAYHATCTIRATSDETPWCAAFVNWCLRQAGYRGTDNALAASWLSYGQPAFDASPGGIVVLRRRDAGRDAATGSQTGNHVGFLLAADSETVTVLGGNQHDQVKESRFPRSAYAVRVVRWPRACDRLVAAA